MINTKYEMEHRAKQACGRNQPPTQGLPTPIELRRIREMNTIVAKIEADFKSGFVFKLFKGAMRAAKDYQWKETTGPAVMNDYMDDIEKLIRGNEAFEGMVSKEFFQRLRDRADNHWRKMPENYNPREIAGVYVDRLRTVFIE